MDAISNRRFVIKFPQKGATATFEYDKNGWLINYELQPGEFTEGNFVFLLKRLPREINIINKWKKAKFKNVIIKEVAPDLSFKTFYDTYAHKVSKRKLAEKIWNAMPDIEKVKALAYLPKYETHLKMTNINKKYPETYLRSEMWNNE